MRGSVAAAVSTLLLMASSAVQAGDRIMYQEVIDNKPDVGVSTTVYLGDRMLEQRRGQWQECIVPKFEVNKSQSMGFQRFIIKKDEPICKSSISAKYYTPTYVNFLTSRPPGLIANIVPTEKDSKYSICFINMGFKGGCEKGKKIDDFDIGPYFVYSNNSLQQTIEYSGRSGDVLKFIYSEFYEGYARQAFTREFLVDMSQGKVAAYKGAVIEIEGATNASITYKVVRNFQQ